MKLKLSSLFFFFILFSSYAQEIRLSNDAKVSVLTVGPGTLLNDAFGHNAFRIKDERIGIDIVYGYGQYDFDAPNFYLKFAQGKLKYLISRNSYTNFYNFYVRQNRTIKQQILNLTTSEKQKLFDYLENNYKPENRRYLYDFFYDNCATRIKDVTQIATTNKIDFVLPSDYETKTFRELIHEHVGLNTWGSFGIDIALGSIIDRKTTPEEQMFLPKYIHAFFGESKLSDSKRLVKSESVLYQNETKNSDFNSLFSPLLIMGILGLLVGFVTYRDSKNNTRSKWLDIIIFAVTGLVGIVILLLWFATDHTATAYNYNLLWAMPLNLLVIGQLFRKDIKNWFKGYLKFLIIMFCLMSLHWVVGVQVFALALIPLLLALAYRYIYLLSYYKNN